MKSRLTIKNLPVDLRNWLDRECRKKKIGIDEFVIAVLRRARQALEMPLFADNLKRQDQIAGGMPFKFIDLFAGIGGFRIALEELGGRCVLSCEKDVFARQTYKAWFGELPHRDIREIDPGSIPDHDLLVAGFPCQPFSIAGVSKRTSLGQPHGFNDRVLGNLFFYLADIIRVKRPPVLLLENVRNLKFHDNGHTWQTIRDTIEALEYVVFARVIDACGWVPQHRERIYIVCFDRNVFGSAPPFVFPSPPEGRCHKVSDILEPNPDPKYMLSEQLWNTLQRHAQSHKSKGHGFGYGIADPEGISRTLSARYYKDGSEILIRSDTGPPRKLTPAECSRLMGFDPAKFRIVVSDTQAYRQFGNAVVPGLIKAIGRQIQNVLAWYLIQNGNGCLVKGRLRNESRGHELGKAGTELKSRSCS
ncbi:MAG: DNA (cytosine-5-)-methyltransferase [Clostridiaceae bacterium]|nr:DNA (cytosine-5-)-methyltransferase [Clostridiaceae bacterium]